MTWSGFDERPDQEELEMYEDDLASEIFEAIDYNFEAEREFIEDHAQSEYPAPDEAPPKLVTASLIGRYAKNNADTFQNIFIKNPVLKELEEGDGTHGDVLSYIGMKTLRNGH